MFGRSTGTDHSPSATHTFASRYRRASAGNHTLCSMAYVGNTTCSTSPSSSSSLKNSAVGACGAKTTSPPVRRSLTTVVRMFIAKTSSACSCSSDHTTPGTSSRRTVTRSPNPKYGSHNGGKVWKKRRFGSRPPGVSFTAADASGGASAAVAAALNAEVRPTIVSRRDGVEAWSARWDDDSTEARTDSREAWTARHARFGREGTFARARCPTNARADTSVAADMSAVRSSRDPECESQ